MSYRWSLIPALTLLFAPAVLGQDGIRFEDITESAGITFVHNSGARGQKYLPETMGPGAAFIDYNNDGWADIFLVNGTNWPGDPPNPSTSRLYRNEGNGTFTDVTRQAGLDVEFYGMGVAVADYDNDGTKTCSSPPSDRTASSATMATEVSTT